MNDQFTYIRPKESSNYSVRLRPVRVNDGVNPPVKKTQGKIDEQSRIFSVTNLDQLDHIVKDYGEHLDTGNLAIVFSVDSDDEKSPDKMYVWDKKAYKWKEMQSSASTEITGIDGGVF